MLAQVVQPALLSLFSSTNSHPLLLATLHTATTLTEDSFIVLLRDCDDHYDEIDVTSHAEPRSARELKGKGVHVVRGNLSDRVLHLQGPDVKATYVEWGSSEPGHGLDCSLPFIHFGLKNLGQSLYIDVGIRDDRGALLIVRVSTFQVRRLTSGGELLLKARSSRRKHARRRQLDRDRLCCTYR